MGFVTSQWLSHFTHIRKRSKTWYTNFLSYPWPLWIGNTWGGEWNWTENENPCPGQPDLPFHHHTPGLIRTDRFFIWESRAKTLACITRVRAHIIHPNPQTCLFYDAMSVVPRAARFDSFVVFDQCCHHKSVSLDRGYTQHMCLQCSEYLPFDKTHPLVHILGSKVMKSYRESFTSLFLFMSSAHLKLPISKQLKEFQYYSIIV